MCRLTVQEESRSGCMSCVRSSPNSSSPSSCPAAGTGWSGYGIWQTGSCRPIPSAARAPGHCDGVSGGIPLCFWRPGRPGRAVGPARSRRLCTLDGGAASAPCASAPVAPGPRLPLAQHQDLGLGGRILVDELKREVVVPAARRSLPVHLAAGSADGQTLCRLHRPPSAGAAGDHRHPLEIIWQSSRSKKLVF